MERKESKRMAFYPYLGFVYCEIIGLDAIELVNLHNSDEFFLNEILLEFYVK